MMPGKKPHHVVAYTLFAALLGLYVLLAARFPLAYIWATYEDLFGEWMQFWALIAALVLSLRLVLTRGRYRWFFGLLALSCLYVAMEEISWGQRLFGFSSPAFFKTHNLQGETNLHNFFTGPFGTPLKAALTYALAAALAAFGVVYPIAVHRRWRPALWLDAHGLAVPPRYLSPAFAVASVLELSLFRFNEAEVAELFVALSLAIMAFHYLFCLRRGCDIHDSASWPHGESRRLATSLATLAALVLNFAALTTLSIYATSDGRARIQNRINNGIEKFARRYARFEQWTPAAELYERVRRWKPGSTATLRKLAETYRRLGEASKADARLQKALGLDLKRYRQDPTAASVNRSLVRTYRMMGDTPKAEEYLQHALEIGLGRIKKHPKSANAAYSLGRTYELMEQDAAALKQFERAFRLKPTSKTFRKAYYAARNRRP